MNGPDALLWCKTLLLGKRGATIVEPDDRMLRKQIRLGACTVESSGRYFETARAALSITSTTSLGCET
jgi:hypothetical protein